MAAGNIMVASASGGPKMDILHPVEPDRPVGFLADTADEFAHQILHVILEMDSKSRDSMRLAARDAAQRFSEEHFAKSWNEAIEPLMY